MNPATEAVLLDLVRSGRVSGAECLAMFVAVEVRDADLAILQPYEEELAP